MKKVVKKNFVSKFIESSSLSIEDILNSVLQETSKAAPLPGELNPNISSSGVSNPTNSILNPNYSDGTPRPIVTSSQPSDANGNKELNAATYPDGTLKRPNPTAPVLAAQAAQAQQKENLKQSEMTSDKFGTLQRTDMDIRRDTEGNLWMKHEDGTISQLPKNTTTPTTSASSPLPSVVEHYDFLDSIIEDNEILAPIEDLDNPDAPSHKGPAVEITIDVDGSKNSASSNYDMFASLPPLDLSSDLEKAVSSSQQGMMPRVIVNDPQSGLLKDGPLGTVSAVPHKEIKSIEEDPFGLSVVGLNNDLALRLM